MGPVVKLFIHQRVFESVVGGKVDDSAPREQLTDSLHGEAGFLAEEDYLGIDGFERDTFQDEIGRQPWALLLESLACAPTTCDFDDFGGRVAL